MKNSISLGFFLMLLTFTTGCFEAEKGCLDADAANYSIEADKACADCCAYPELKVDFQHKAFLTGGAILDVDYLDTFYLDGAGNSFRLRNIQYYLSDFHLVRQDGSEVKVEEVLDLELENDLGQIELVSVENNVALVDPGRFGAKTMGRIRSNGNFSGIRFNIGLNATLNKADTLDFDLSHPLAPKTENMYLGDGQGYIFTKISYFLNNNSGNNFNSIAISGNSNLLAIEIPAKIFIDKGLNSTFILRVNYLDWFKYADLTSTDTENLSKNIVKGIAESFSLLELRLN